ncbi:META domain-containing protein [Sphingosinicella sp. CPCC 101087]|uniref:META domain-containing protein n=1 Tax=Sphingosinicella sp. CPCC 101087 TaxID=2497754 RepID=UPI00101CDC6F|nr:META domain-containing protein [Sphingosinicella sp. CPCC 101087]
MRAHVISLVAAGAALLQPGCATPPSPSGPSLVGTEWRLVHFESSKDAIGNVRPGPEESYTLLLARDGTASMQLSCNRGTGSWSSPDAAQTRGRVTIQPLASTMAACPPGQIERLPADLSNVRTFVIADGRLHLNLMMDGGDYVWAPVG